MAASDFTITQPEQMVIYDKLLKLLQNEKLERDEVVNFFLALGFTVDVADRILSNPELLQDTIDQMQDSLRQWQANVTLSDVNNLKDFEEIVISTAGDELISFFNGDNMDMALLNLKKLGISRKLLNQALLVAVKQPEHWHPIKMVEKLLSIPITRGIGKGVAMGPNNYDWAMAYAAGSGHLDIVNLMLLKGATQYNDTMRQAARGGHMEIVKLMLLKGATHYNDAMVYAARCGHQDIVELMLLKGATHYNEAMEAAARNGHIDIVKLMLLKGARNYDWAMQSAAEGGHLDIVKLLLLKGATNYNWAMLYAGGSGHLDIVELMLSKGARNYDWAMTEAARNGHQEIVKLMTIAMQNQ